MNRHEQRSVETRGRLLRAAEASFARFGYDRTGVAEICEAAGVSKGAFYHHFSTKQDIFVALLNRWLAGLERELVELRDRPGSVPDALLAMTQTVQTVLDDAAGRLPIYLEFLIQAKRDPTVWQATIEPYRRYRDFFAEILERGIAEGSLRPIDSRAASRAIVSLGIGLLLQALLDPDEADREAVWRSSLGLLLDSISARVSGKVAEGGPGDDASRLERSGGAE